ncbi:MAG TPA: PhoU domain-containing protein, partial [Brevibacillus sp.]|nr:PhoU domain-containing protein [Brevibacillus sp.]
DSLSQATHLLLVAQYLERIADHVTNICEWIIYMKTGKMTDLNQ